MYNSIYMYCTSYLCIPPESLHHQSLYPKHSTFAGGREACVFIVNANVSVYVRVRGYRIDVCMCVCERGTE